ncbi:hypothetical protein [Chishuiella sp.]|uniref:hypothetical protein n=1 Tax=Chishuiella sp. TaxID=1969467 RepID=UPI0028A647D7|nr:hypothetical protein [Chishuiella sp.]
MQINFNTIWIGKPRIDKNVRRILDQNEKFLKFDIVCFLNDFDMKISAIMPITIIVPENGFNVQFDVRDIQNNDIKAALLHHFKSRIFDQNRSILIGNFENKIV